VSNFLYLAVAAIFVLVIAGFVLRLIIGSAIRDQRRVAETVRQEKANWEIERQLEPLRESRQFHLDRRNKTRERVSAVRDTIPVWGAYNEPSPEAVQAYAKAQLKNNSFGISTYRILHVYEGMEKWLDRIGEYYFYLEEANCELDLAIDQHRLGKVLAKIAKLEKRDYSDAKKEKRRLKRAVAYLHACVAQQKWQLKWYINYCHLINDKAAPVRGEPFYGIRINILEQDAKKEAGPMPVARKPKGFDPVFRWSTTELGNSIHPRVYW
jgi:hypothetical protein